jgi:hypothetical protein
MAYLRAECNKRGFYPTPRGVLGGCFRCRAAKMRNCTCYEDLEVKRRNTELNDSFVHTTAPHDRSEISRETVPESNEIENVMCEKKVEPKIEPIRIISGSSRPRTPMDDIQDTLERLKNMRDQGLIDGEE